jgi:hypothetical protein
MKIDTLLVNEHGEHLQIQKHFIANQPRLVKNTTLSTTGNGLSLGQMMMRIYILYYFPTWSISA